jgi:NADPH:quinone reductase-like Zn-dependent oxidoreductase
MKVGVGKAIRRGSRHQPSQAESRCRSRHADGPSVGVVLDHVADDIWPKSLAVLARGGKLVTCGATAGGRPGGVSSGTQFLQVSRIRPIIDRPFLLKDAAAAQQHMERAQQSDKIILHIADQIKQT